MRKAKSAASAKQLVAMHRGPVSSQSAAAHIMRQVRENGLPSAISASSQRRARQREASISTSFGDVLVPMKLKTQDGDDLTVWISSPLALLEHTVRVCPGFRAFFKNALAQHPCTIGNPWGLILYFDEVSPTDPVSPHADMRKIQGVYWTFVEFVPFTSRDELWFILACIPSHELEDVDSGMAQVIGSALRQFFFDPAGHNLATSGAAFDLQDGRAMQHLFAEHAILIADFLAISDFLGSMAQNGLAPCPICRNIVKDDIAAAGVQLGLSNLDCSAWILHTDASICALFAYMAAKKPTMTPNQFEYLESRVGYHYSEHSIIVRSPSYKPISTLCFD